MFYWRITKYDPQYRDERGAYLKNEWTEYDDIGQTFEGKTLTLKEYLKTEDAYIQAILLFIEDLNIDSLRISCLEKNGRRPKKVLVDGIEIVNNTYVNKESIIPIIRLILRGKTWCKFKAKQMLIDFSNQFYTFIVSINRPSNSTIKKIEHMGFFVEELESPYKELLKRIAN